MRKKIKGKGIKSWGLWGSSFNVAKSIMLRLVLVKKLSVATDAKSLIVFKINKSQKEETHGIPLRNKKNKIM